MLKKVIALCLSAMIWSTALVGTAAADAPEPFTVEFSFEDVNPCTGEPHVITIELVIRERVHKNNFVATVRASGSTSDGYTMVSGSETVVETKKGVNARFMDRWVGEDGSKFQARGSFGLNFETEKLRKDTFVLRCIGR